MSLVIAMNYWRKYINHLHNYQFCWPVTTGEGKCHKVMLDIRQPHQGSQSLVGAGYPPLLWTVTWCCLVGKSCPSTELFGAYFWFWTYFILTSVLVQLPVRSDVLFWGQTLWLEAEFTTQFCPKTKALHLTGSKPQTGSRPKNSQHHFWPPEMISEDPCWPDISTWQP